MWSIMGGLFSKDVDDKISRTKEDNEQIVKSVFEILECRACLESCQAPIFTCVNGHVLCSDCKEKVEHCPVCGVPGTPSTRNLPLDTLSDRVLTVPCKFQPKGCGVKRSREEDLEVHYRNCRYKSVYKCLVQPYCDFVGSGDELYEHAQIEHSGNVLVIPKKCGVVLNTLRNERVTVIFKENAEDEYFWICVRCMFRPTGKIVVYSKYIGPDVHASKFSVHLKIESRATATTMQFNRSPLTLDEDDLVSKNTVLLDDSDLTLDGNITFTISVQDVTKMDILL